MNEKIDNGKWWMWSVMPIGAIAGATLASAAISFIFVMSGHVMIGGLYGADFLTDVIGRLFSYGIFGYVFAYLSHKLAPRGKDTATIVMVSILVVFTVASVFGKFFVSPEVLSVKDGAIFLIGDVTMIAMAIEFIRETGSLK